MALNSLVKNYTTPKVKFGAESFILYNLPKHRIFWDLSTAISAHFLPKKDSRSLIIFGFHVCTAFFKFHQIFSVELKYEDWTGHSRTFYHRSPNKLSRFGCVLWDSCPVGKSIDQQSFSLCTKCITIFANIAWYFKETVMHFIQSRL